MLLENKVVLVTGATSGIGLASVELFQKEGAKVIAVGRNQDVLTRLAKTTAHVVCADLTSEADCLALQNTILSEKIPLTSAFNCAGAEGAFGQFHALSPSQTKFILDANLLTMINVLRLELNLLLKNPQPNMAIVNCSSVAGESGFAPGAVYAATKAAVINLTRSLAQDYGGNGVRLNCLCPGGTLTEMTTRVEKQFPGWVESGSAKTPLGRFGQPLEVAQAALWLLSDRSSYVTGAVLRADGGVGA
jgi:A-factor type gamma-butyrolactone 1'-reductase (1S-forming)